MARALFITEETLPKEYIAKSLEDKIFQFQTSLINGALFHLPEGPTLGGDNFIIYSDSLITTVILNDFPEKRREAREVIKKVRSEFMRLIGMLKTPKITEHELSEMLYAIETKLAFELETQSAVTVLKFPERELLYFNGGENFLFYYNSETKQLERDLHRGPKLGILSKFQNKQKVLPRFTFNKKPTLPGDKIVICTDGVGDITPSKSFDRSYLEHVVQGCITEPPEKIIQYINAKNNENLSLYQLKSDQNVPDDYTIIVLEIR
ncbi:hypothetical protein DRZ77_02280 [Candidatus Woesearchaeota archaeon]|nr:MAG: hypothetical protein DRZ77_02280 [Candidatus Woesearchaeota archaeon]